MVSATHDSYTLSLHDALPISFLTAYYMREYGARREDFGKLCVAQRANALKFEHALFKKPHTMEEYLAARPIAEPRSEEHTSELQSRRDLVCRLLLEKKKIHIQPHCKDNYTVSNTVYSES